MMQFIPTAFLLTAFYLLTSVATAFAEGLWILSFPDKATCEAFEVPPRIGVDADGQ